MGRLIKLTKHGVALGAALGASVLVQGTAHAQDVPPPPPDCSLQPNPMYISGSSAAKPVLAGLSQLFKGVTLMYVSGSASCAGVQAALGTPQTATPKVSWWAPPVSAGGPPVETPCNLPAARLVDLAVSDVFPTSCTGVTADMLKAASVADFDTFFNQVMEFVVPFNSDQTSISAEAAYLTFGLGDQGATPWDNPGLFYIRNSTSGTQTMLGKAIKLDASKWVGIDSLSSAGVVSAISTPAGDPKKTIGIVSSNEADPAPDKIKKLAFQGYGQDCAYWPDSGVAEKDKAYVRDGHYPVWGPLHMLTKVNAQGVPTDANAKAFIDLLTKQEQATVDVEIDNNVVPLCAMNVARDSEIGPLMSVQPTGARGCYFDSKRKTGGASKTDCKVCTAANEATVCTGAAKHCNYGYCEVK